MPRTRKPSIQKAGTAPVMVAEPEPTPIRPADAPAPPRGSAQMALPIRFREGAREARTPLERVIAMHLAKCAV